MIKKYHYFIGIFLLGVLIFNFGVGNTVSDDDDNDGVDDDFEELNKRNIDVFIDDENNEFTINSSLRKGEKIDVIEIDVEYDDGLRVEFSYNSENDSLEIELEFNIVFVSIVEYNDTNEDGMYNETDDEYVQEVPLNSFQDVNYTTEVISTNSSLHYFIINTTDGIFTAYFYVVEEFAIVNSSLITPTQIKIDIEINNFNYSSNKSRLALETRLESDVDYEEEEQTEDENYGFSTDEEWLTTTMNDTTGFFTKIDGLTKNVLISNKTIENDYEIIYINYPNGTHIYHDPKVGVAGVLKSVELRQEDKKSEKSTIKSPLVLTIVYVLAAILIIGGSIAATSIYYYDRRKKSAKYFDYYGKKGFEKSIGSERSSSSILKDLNRKSYLIQIFEEENALEKISELNDMNLTAISNDFMEIIDQFDWEEDDKEEFIKEMLALTPKERKAILNEMKEKSW
jgi:hypothetical protein